MQHSDNSLGSVSSAVDLRWADQWRSALLRVLQTTGSIITAKRLTYKTLDLGFAPAASNDDSVLFDEQQLSPQVIVAARDKSRLDDVVRNCRSLSYHELCHVLWTPSVYSDFGRWVQTSGASQIFNMIEDQRIENLFCKHYSSASSYFKLAVSTHILKGTCSRHDVYLLIAGRLYLPRKQRRAARKAAIEHYGEAMIRSYEEHLFRYMGLLFDRDHLAARGILESLMQLFASVNSSLPQNACSDSHGQQTASRQSGNDSKSPSKTDKENSSSVNDELQDELDALGGNDNDDDEGGSPSESSESVDADAESELTDSGSDSTESGETSDATMGNSSSESEQETDSSDPAGDCTGNSAGSGESEVPSMDTLSEVLDWAQEVCNDALAETQTDVANIQNAVSASVEQQRMAERSRWPGVQRPVTSQMRVASTRIIKEITTLRTALEPHWERRQLSGKVNLSRLVGRSDPSDLAIFDRWHEGSEEDASMELALLLDISSSMAGYEDQLGQMMWVLQDSLSQLEISLTIGVYADARHTSAVLPTERPNPATYLAPRVQGATNPGPLIEKLRTQLQGSPATHRIMLIMTDGHWGEGSYSIGRDNLRGNSDTVTSDESIAVTNSLGIFTGLFGLGNAVKAHGSHGCQFATDIDSLDDITEAVRKIVLQITAQSVL